MKYLTANDIAEELGVSRTRAYEIMLTLLRARGVEPSLLGVFAGHADGRMAERVYGRLAPEQLGHLLETRLRGTAGVQPWTSPYPLHRFGARGMG